MKKKQSEFVKRRKMLCNEAEMKSIKCKRCRLNFKKCYAKRNDGAVGMKRREARRNGKKKK